jgi:hypothetical protein
MLLLAVGIAKIGYVTFGTHVSEIKIAILVPTLGQVHRLLV